MRKRLSHGISPISEVILLASKRLEVDVVRTKRNDKKRSESERAIDVIDWFLAIDVVHS
jgi:hypothetical protein